MSAKEKQTKFALVLFDIDGCTAVVPTSKLKSDELAVSVNCQISFGSRNLEVEILALSDDVKDLNGFEHDWSQSKRSIALDVEKKRRNGKDRGGFLQIRPSKCLQPSVNSETTDEVVPEQPSELELPEQPSVNTETTDETVQKEQSEQELPEQSSKKIGIQALGDLVNKVRKMKKKVILELPDTQIEREIVPVKRKRKEETKKVMLSSGVRRLKSASARKEHVKEGNNGRVVNILHEGSGNYLDENTEPKRSPCHLDEMTDDERDIILNRVAENSRGVRSIQTQTEPVLIFTSENEIDAAFRKPSCVCKEQTHVLEEINNKKLEEILKILKKQSSAQIIEKNEEVHNHLTEVHNHLTEVHNHLTDTENKPELKIEEDDFTSSLPHKEDLHEDPIYTQTEHNEINRTTETENNKPEELTIIVKQEPDEDYDYSFESTETEQIHESAKFRNETEHVTYEHIINAGTKVPDQSIETGICSKSEDPKSYFYASPLDIQYSIINYTDELTKPEYTEISHGKYIEITSPKELDNIPSDTDVRIARRVQRSIRANCLTAGSFAWNMTQQIYNDSELKGRNCYGRKGKLPLSPRRLNGMRHAVADSFGENQSVWSEAVNTINQGLRNKFKTKKERVTTPLGNLQLN